MHHDDEKSGFIFLMALFVLTGLASVMAVGLSRTMTEQLAARTNTQKLQAFHLAEAGVDDLRVQLSISGATVGDPPWTQIDGDADGFTKGSDPDDYVERLYLTGTASELLGAGDIQVRVYGWQLTTLLVQAVGFVPNRIAPRARETVELQLRLPRPSPFQQAILALEDRPDQYGINLIMVPLTSYDSTLGFYNDALSPPDPTYGPVNRSDVSRPATWNATLATNSVSEAQFWPAITLSSVAFGDLSIGLGGNLSQAIDLSGAVHYGDSDAAYHPAPSDPPLPTTPPMGGLLFAPNCLPANPPIVRTVTQMQAFSRVDLGEDCQLVIQQDGNLRLDWLLLGMNSRLTFEGKIQTVAGGVKLDYGSRIRILNNPVELYVTGTSSSPFVEGFKVQTAAGLTNSSKDPKKFTLYISDTSGLPGNQNDQIVFGVGTGMFYGAIYAPYSEVRFNMQSSVSGAIISRQTRMSPLSAFRFDEALRTEGTWMHFNNSPWNTLQDIETLLWRQPVE